MLGTEQCRSVRRRTTEQQHSLLDSNEQQALLNDTSRCGLQVPNRALRWLAGNDHFTSRACNKTIEHTNKQQRTKISTSLWNEWLCSRFKKSVVEPLASRTATASVKVKQGRYEMRTAVVCCHLSCWNSQRESTLPLRNRKRKLRCD